LKEWTTPDCRNTPSTTNREEEEIVDAPGNDGNASMPEQVKRPNPWRKMIIYFDNCSWVDTRWQYYSTHLHTNNTENTTMKQNTQNRTYITIRIHNYTNTQKQEYITQQREYINIKKNINLQKLNRSIQNIKPYIFYLLVTIFTTPLKRLTRNKLRYRNLRNIEL